MVGWLRKYMKKIRLVGWIKNEKNRWMVGWLDGWMDG